MDSVKRVVAGCLFFVAVLVVGYVMTKIRYVRSRPKRLPAYRPER